MTDVKKLISEHLDIWLTAETEKKSGRGRSSGSSNSIYGVQKLRELILELAFLGKLVPNEAKSFNLLEQILSEQEELVKNKILKKTTVINILESSEFSYSLPNTWALLKLADSGYNLGQKVPDSKFSYIDVSAINSIFGRVENQSILNADEAPSRARKKVCQGTIIYSTIRPYLNNIAVIDKVFEYEPIASTAFAVIHPYKAIDSYYLFYYLRSPLFVKYVESQQVGIAYPAINDKQFFSGLLPVPPLDEQQRIVAKLNELMQLCDQLEQQQNLSSEAHDQLVDTLLNVLTNSSDVDEFQQNWQRISENFNLLFTTEYSIEQLKQTILQLAVMGKLVKQDPADEPASELLEQIAQEKNKLVKDGKIKKSKPLPEIDLDKVPFEIPDSWAWARFSELGEFARGKSKHRPRNDPALFNPPIYPLVQTGEVARAGNIILEYHSKYSEVGLAQSRMWSKGTLCITIAANIADSAILGFDACFPDSVVGFTPVEPLYSARYLLFFMKTARQQLLEYAPATAQKNINLEILESVYIPIPPLNEQEKIIQTVDEFLNICNVLKDKIKHVNSIKCELSDALVSNALKDSNSIGKPKVADNLIYFEKPIGIVKNSKQKSTDQIDLFADESVDDDLKLLSLAAEITFQLHTEPTFGHLKLQKLIYLCQQLKHMDLAANFGQHAAGPYDPVMARYLDKEFKDREWFSYDPKRDLKYKPLSKCNDHRSAFNKYFAKETSDIYALIGLFRTSKSDHIEIVATLFACWLRLLENKQSITEELLLKDFYAWSEEKKRFGKNEVLNGFKWMKQNLVVPLENV